MSVHASGSWVIAGRTVARLGYGAMQITGQGVWGPPEDPEGAKGVLRRAVELGVNFIDTADSYGPEVSAQLIADALYPYGEVLIATKAGLTRTGPGLWHPVGRPEYLRQQCELSLRRLKLEAIDLFQLHRVDPKVDADEQYGLLAELLAEGKVKAIGLSQVSVEQVEAARKIVEVSSVQNLYNAVDRSSEDLLDYCEQHNIAFIPWFPIASGQLAGEQSPLAQVARELGSTPSQVSLAWLLARSPVVLPIPGTKSIAHLEENCLAADLLLSPEQVERIAEAAAQ
ncbi:MAG: aldo/keto reductase [Actinomycetota bacterium]